MPVVTSREFERDPTFITRLDPDRDPHALPDGIRLAVKDCIDVAGEVTTAGSPAVAAGAEPAAVRDRARASMGAAVAPISKRFM